MTKKTTLNPFLVISILFTVAFMVDHIPNAYAQTIEDRLDALEANDIVINTTVSDMYDYMVELFTVLFSALPVIQDDVEGLKNGTITVPVDWSTISSIPADIADGDADTQLSEIQVDSFVSNNGYVTTVSWNDIVGIPSDIADGDDLSDYVDTSEVKCKSNSAFTCTMWCDVGYSATNVMVPPGGTIDYKSPNEVDVYPSGTADCVRTR